jgi:hypothetical protein
VENKTQINHLDIKKAIKAEYKKCATDPVHFMRKYCMIQHPQKSRVKFDLYLFQIKVLNLIQNIDNDLIINKSRQLGISTLVAMYILWLMIFHQDKNIVIVATKQETAKNMVTKIAFAYENLPSWLKPKTESFNKLSIRFANGSQVKAVSKAGDSGRSEAASLLVLDEAAFIDNVGTIFTAAQQTLATGGKCIAISTPNGTGNWFYEEFTKAELGQNKFTAIKLPWTVHPERDQSWRDEQDKILGVRDAAQECDASFLTSGATVIDPETLTYFDEMIEHPLEKRGMGGSYWIWEYPDFTKTYAVIADTARGDGSDYSTFQVVEIETFKQVAEFKDHIDTRMFGNFLVAVSTEWNNALLIIENTGVGWDVVQTAIQREYQNLYYSPRSSEASTNVDLYLKKFDKQDGMVPGFTNSTFTRPLVVSKLINILTNKNAVIKSKRTMDELRAFIWKNGKAQAESGNNDDLVMPLAIGAFLRDTVIMFRQYGNDLTRAAIDNIGTSEQVAIMYTPHNPMEGNPWKTKNIWGDEEDLTWLLK